MDSELLDDIDGMAAFWLVTLNAADCTPESRFAFDAWKRESPAHEDAYLRVKRGNDYLDRFMATPEFQDRIELARNRTRPSIAKRVFAGPYIGWAMAASVLFAVMSIGFFGPSQTNVDQNSILVAKTPIDRNVEVFETKVGERSTVTLADGSVVTINTNSKIEVNYSPETREIHLLWGQGYFEVAKDINRPFVVVAQGKRVVALGTVFDVRFDSNNEIQVTLVEGRVKIDDVALDLKVAESGVKLIANATVELNPGERLIAKTNAESVVVKTDTIEETSWRKGYLVFRERTLGDVVIEMNRYSSQKLVIDSDTRVAALLVSGVFNTGGPPSDFVDALEAMHPLEAKRSGENELKLVWKN